MANRFIEKGRNIILPTRIIYKQYIQKLLHNPYHNHKFDVKPDKNLTISTTFELGHLVKTTFKLLFLCLHRHFLHHLYRFYLCLGLRSTFCIYLKVCLSFPLTLHTHRVKHHKHPFKSKISSLLKLKYFIKKHRS